MKLVHLIGRELLFRKASSALAIVSIVLCSALICAVLYLFQAYNQSSEAVLKEKEARVQKQMKDMAEEYRKIGVGMGFNILILPEGQNVADFYADDFASEYMPEKYAAKLANSRIITVRHLLPSLSQKITWPEYRRKIILTGVRGEIPRLHLGPGKKAIVEAVPSGKIVLGYELHTSLGLVVGDTVMLRSRPFVVHENYEQRGNLDDITTWINLHEAQEMLGKKDQINAILALECRCTGTTKLANLAQIRKDVSDILPGTHVVEFMSKAIARAEGRWKVVQVAKDRLEKEKRHHLKLRNDREKTIALIVPLAIIGTGILIGLLTLTNARARQTELGLFRAVGISEFRILFIFLGKAIFIGLIGGIIGSMSGTMAALYFSPPDAGMTIHSIAQGWVPLAGVIIGAPVISLMAAWIPALIASWQDPARILMRE